MAAHLQGDRLETSRLDGNATERLARPLPDDVLAAVIVYIPHLRGYFTNRMTVLRLCLESLLRHKPAGTKVLAFDNGSCAEVEAFLTRLLSQSRIDYLVRSRSNIGVLAALRMICQLSIRPVIAYGDDDVFYYPGWLEPQLDLLIGFPEAGMVSGIPTLDGARHGVESTLRIARGDEAIRLEDQGRPPEAWEAEWARSTGRNVQEHLRLSREKGLPKLLRGGRQAFVGAVHFQFVARTSTLVTCMPPEWPTSLMGGMRELDESVDRAGLMRLSTVDRHVVHMGNEVHADLRREASRLGLEVGPAGSRPRPSLLSAARARSRRLHGWLWVAYRRVGLLLDGEEARPDPEAASWGRDGGER
jgi:hypothetical protein